MENTRRKNEDFIHAFNEITSSKEELDNKVQNLLRLGVRRFRLPIGILSKVIGEQYRVVHVEAQDNSIKLGDIFELGQMYCADTLRSSTPIGFHRVKNTKRQKHPCYKATKLEAYLGMPVIVFGRPYGTLNFSGRDPLASKFTRLDEDFIQLMAAWVGGELECAQLEQQLSVSDEQVKLINIQLADAKDRALEASYLKSAFLATMSHEFRTPMNAILGMNEMLLNTNLTREQHGFAQIIETSTQSLLAILNSILDFSKIEAGKASIQSVPFKPASLVQETVNLFQSGAREKNISLSVMVTSVIPEVLVGDAVRIRQILGNLVSNAIKFTRKGGVVFINLSGTHIDDEMLMITFSVQDSGIGISDEARTRLFEPFTQADSTETRQHGGVGLGLAISKRLVDLMHGEMGFESIEDTGSTFWFSLPLGKNLLKRVELEESKENFASRRHKNYSGCKPILIVEDNLINRDLLVMQLREFGLTARHAGNGREAMELLQVEPDTYSMVLMDLNMPDMDGVTATRFIRRHEEKTNKHTLIVALTANAMAGIRETCLQSGMDDFLAKPISLADMDSLLAKWLS